MKKNSHFTRNARLSLIEWVIIFSVILAKLSHPENMIFPLYITKRGNIRLPNPHSRGNMILFSTKRPLSGRNDLKVPQGNN